MTALEKLRQKKADILALVQRYGAENIRVFGSVLHGDERPDSDIDLLVDWDKEHSLFDKIGLRDDLEDLLGKKVDLCQAKTLHWFVKDSIIADAKPL